MRCDAVAPPTVADDPQNVLDRVFAEEVGVGTAKVLGCRTDRLFDGSVLQFFGEVRSIAHSLEE